MSQIDPDDTPTRRGEPKPPRTEPPGPDERTLPAFTGRQQPTPERSAPPPKPAPSPRPAPPNKPAPPPKQPGADPNPAAGTDLQDPLIGKMLGGCRITKLLGRGAMGAVYKARQEKLDRDVAIKIIRPEMMTDQRMLKRFEVEARIVGKFNSANVVMVHDVGFELGVHYLVMEFVQGKNLRDHVKLLAGGRLPVGDALPMLRQAIRGLEEAQRLNVVHRDIKPDNLMITDRGVLKIADFGIAKPLHEDFSMTLTSELVGTPLYMSPEQCQGEAEIDFRSDMYSLGATFFYLLTGEPPIRASSVYELIQTKTKMAHLCLWKALPGLDENNPLSRVVERMTALDREDRYGSYEELLNDLVLVEQGQTIVPKPSHPGDEAQTKVAAVGQVKGKVAGKATARRGALALGLLLLAALGGGYAFWVSRSGAGGDPARVGQRFADEVGRLRQRLAEQGPSQSLLTDLGNLNPASAPQQDERGKLIDDVTAGLQVKAAIDAVKKPAKLELPFNELFDYLQLVDAKSKPATKVGPEVAAFCEQQRVAARSESELGALALSVLTSTFSQWQSERLRAGGDDKKIAELGGRLDAIYEARNNLSERLSNLRDRLRADLPLESLDAARAALRDRTMLVEVDLTTRLADLRRDFDRLGPDASLRDTASKLQPTRPEQQTARDELINEMERARVAVETAQKIQAEKLPRRPEPPFDAVGSYWSAIDRALQGVRNAQGELPPWAAARRQELRAEATLQEEVVAACLAAFTRWQNELRKTPQAVSGLAAVRIAKAKAIELFAGARAALDAAIPDTELDAAATEVARTSKRQQWLADAERMGNQLATVSTLADWTAIAAAVGTGLGALREGAVELANEPEVASTIKRLSDSANRWSTAAAAVAELDQRLAGGDLTAATKLARGGAVANEGRAEFTLATEAVGLCTDAFDELGRTLAIDAAEAKLADAQTKLRGSSYFVRGAERVGKWLTVLRALRTAASGMVPIPAGRPKGNAAAIDSFFLAATECSRAEFAQFLGEVKQQAGSGDAAAMWARVEARLPNCGLNPDRLRELLAREVKPDKMPIENVTWFAAAAHAAWYGRTLPTAEQWLLAALGDGGKTKYPWGNDWPPDPKARNPNNTSAVEVDAGGLSWRANEGVRIHHLGGNVAEWLASPPGDPGANLAGSRYSDGDSSVKEYASGALQPADKPDGRKGFGFRTALRLRSFPGLDWPR